MYNYLDLQDTIVAVASPAGAGAIAVIRLSGKSAISIANGMFRAKDLSQQDSHSLHLGYIYDEAGQRVDQVLCSVFKGPTSYTREDVIEFSCHGSPYIQQRLLSLCLRSGARLAKEGEFTLRAFLNGQLDLAQAEAVADLISADSEAAHQMALQQMRGGFSQQIEGLRKELLQFASLLELELDFGEEDVEFAQRKELEELLLKIRAMIKQLMDSFQLGNVLKEGVSTVLAGRPNAGKSTLLNALLNEERAIVSDIAGTTRDSIEELLNIDGIQFRLIDTAGIREASDQIEAIGVEKTYEKIAQSTVLLYVYDASQLSQEECEADLARLRREGLSVLVLANKCDQLGEGAVLPADHFRLSAKQKEGLGELRSALRNLVVEGQIHQQGTTVNNLRHYQALEEGYQAIDAALIGLEEGLSGDLLAMDIRAALRALGEITGKVDVEDLLENIFGQFCIGK